MRICVQYIVIIIDYVIIYLPLIVQLFIFITYPLLVIHILIFHYTIVNRPL